MAGDQFILCQKVISQAQLSRKLMKCVPWQAEGKRFFNQVFQRNSQSFQSKIPFCFVLLCFVSKIPFGLEEAAKIETLIKKNEECCL